MKICKFNGCDREVAERGYCSKHYRQYMKYGKVFERTRFDPNEFIEHQNFIEIVLYDKNCNVVAKALTDKCDNWVKNYKWHLCSRGYAITRTNGKTVNLHKFIFPDHVVDHINRNGLDNRRCNLRKCTKQQNAFNRNINSNNTSGVTGVCWDKKSNKWRVQINIGKKINLGSYDKFRNAKFKRKRAERQYFKEFSPTGRNI